MKMNLKSIISPLLCAAMALSNAGAVFAADSSPKITGITAVQNSDETYDVTFTFNKAVDSGIRAYYATYGTYDELSALESKSGTGSGSITLPGITQNEYARFIVLDGIDPVSSGPLSWDSVTIAEDEAEEYEYLQNFGTIEYAPVAWATASYMAVRPVTEAPSQDYPSEVTGSALCASASGSGNREGHARIGKRINMPTKTAELSFDYYMASNTNASTANKASSIFSLGDYQSSTSDTDMSGTFFALKCQNKNQLSYYNYSSGSWVTCSANFLDQWVKIAISLDFETKAVSFTVKDKSGKELMTASSSGFDAATLNKVVMSGFRNGGSTYVNTWLDNLDITGTFAAVTATAAPSKVTEPRIMEKLGRGVMAVRSGNSAYINWRSFAPDEANGVTGFNIYRNGKKITASPITDTTNYLDSGVSLTGTSSAVTYEVRAVVNGVESKTDKGSYTLSDMTNLPRAVVTLKDKDGNKTAAGQGSISDVWVGDFTGNGEYDFLVARGSSATNSGSGDTAEDAVENSGTINQKLEAYQQDGTYMWTVDLGPNSLSGGSGAKVWGSTQLFKGQIDGATVYDMDMDGYAEVIEKIANGVTFGDGYKFVVSQTEKSRTDTKNKIIYENVGSTPYTTDRYAALYSSYAPSTEYVDRCQWWAILDGRTGALKAKYPITNDYISEGPYMANVGIGYLDGVHPSIVASMKIRDISSGSDTTVGYHVTVAAYDYDGSKMSEKWITQNGREDRPTAHQIRLADVDGDGRDDFCDIGYVLNGQDGSLKYSLGPDEVIHGDRFFIGAATPDNKLYGYAIQQKSAFGLEDYGYDPATGEILWRNETVERPAADLARGSFVDIDPKHAGFEAWSFTGLFEATTGEQISTEYPYPAFTMWWDGDLLGENFNDGKIEKWDPETESTTRLLSTVSSSFGGRCGYRSAAAFYGDIWGDWREEVIEPNSDNTQLIIATTTSVTPYKIYCLAQNPMYRNCMTVKGYKQSHTLDFYLGDGMNTPPTPNIKISTN